MEPLKEKKRHTTDSNYCEKCNIQCGSKMDNDYGLVWFGLIVVQRVANTGSIYFVLDYLAKMKMKKHLLKSQNIILKNITP